MANTRVAVTHKKSANQVFFGRDHGYFGRIMSQTVVALEHTGGPQRQRGGRILLHSAGRESAALHSCRNALVSRPGDAGRPNRHTPPLLVPRDLMHAKAEAFVAEAIRRLASTMSQKRVSPSPRPMTSTTLSAPGGRSSPRLRRDRRGRHGEQRHLEHARRCGRPRYLLVVVESSRE